MNSSHTIQSDTDPKRGKVRRGISSQSIRALLLRDWIVMRSWLLSLTLVVLAGPVINFLNAIGASSSVRLTSVFESIYMTSPMGTIDAINHHIMALDFRPHVPIYIQGYPPASLWVLSVASALGVLMSTFDKQTLAIADTLNEPIHRNEWISSKLLFGTGSLVVMVVLRTIVLWLSNMLSPLHFSVSTLIFSGVINVFDALATFSVVFFMGLLVGNVVLGWALGFLALAFPLTVGAVIGFFKVIPNINQVTYNLEHHVVLKLSTFWYTDYNTNVVQHFPTQALQSPWPPRIQGMTIYTAVSHPWLLVIGTFIVCIVAYLCSVWVFSNTNAEKLSDLFISSRALHTCLTFVSLMLGSIAAQIFGHVHIPVFIGSTIVSYVVLWLVYRQVETLGISREKRKNIQAYGS